MMAWAAAAGYWCMVTRGQGTGTGSGGGRQTRRGQ